MIAYAMKTKAFIVINIMVNTKGQWVSSWLGYENISKHNLSWMILKKVQGCGK